MALADSQSELNPKNPCCGAMCECSPWASRAIRSHRAPAAYLAQAGEQGRYSCSSLPVSRPQRGSRRNRGRMLEQLMRLKQNLHRCRHVSGNVRLNHRKEPALALHPSGKAEVGTHPIIPTHSEIGQRAASGNELLADFLVPEIELQPIA